MIKVEKLKLKNKYKSNQNKSLCPNLNKKSRQKANNKNTSIKINNKKQKISIHNLRKNNLKEKKILIKKTTPINNSNIKTSKNSNNTINNNKAINKTANYKANQYQILPKIITKSKK